MVLVLSIQVVKFYSQNDDLKESLDKLTAEVGALQFENTKLQDDILYFQNPENLAKELKSRFDYKRPGETLIKIQ